MAASEVDKRQDRAMDPYAGPASSVFLVHRELQSRGIMTAGEVGVHGLEDADQTHLARGVGQGYSGKYLDDISKPRLRDDLAEAARRGNLEYFVAKRVWQT